MTSPTLDPYDAVLLLSFGGPQAPDQVMPFLRSVTAARGIPDERLAEVAEHYHHFGGRSPIVEETHALRSLLEQALRQRGLHTPVLLANRHLGPSVADALREAATNGWHRVVTVLTSAYSSYSSCRQYREDLAAGWAQVRDEGVVVEIDKLAPYAGTPAFRVPQRRLLADAIRSSDVSEMPDECLRVLFVTHSLPETMNELSGPGDGDGWAYTDQHLAVAADVMAAVERDLGRRPASELVFCSRSGPPNQPWLEPDVNDRLTALPAEGVRAVVAAPIGFVSDHMEVVYDLDTEAAATAEAAGLHFVRVPTVGRRPEFADGLVDLLVERAAEARGAAVTSQPGMPSVCASGCCPNLRTTLPALCGQD
jgi:ferrochelatase